MQSLFSGNTERVARIVLPTAVTLLTVLLLLAGCNPGRVSREFSEIMEGYLVNFEDDTDGLYENAVFNPVILARLYVREEGLLRAKWDNLENIDQLINTVRYSYREGLNPEDYHIDTLEYLLDTMLAGEAKIADSVVFDILLTDAFLTLAAHFAGGKTDRREFLPVWNVRDAETVIYWPHFVDSSLINMQVEENLLSLLPAHNEYRNLRSSLEKYRGIGEEGGWDHFSTSLDSLEKGMRHPDIPRLRSRLAAEQGDPAGGSMDKELFDRPLLEQVELFQRRHSLPDDGIVDEKVIVAMNIPLYDLMDVIEANLDRWRWMPADMPERILRVNIPSFELYALEKGNPEFSLKVIVGTDERPTPVFASAIKWIELNPYWIVPPGMLEDDILPAIRQDVGYLESRNMKVLSEDFSVVDPDSVDWHSDFDNGFPYIIRQEPGPYNQMGNIKLELPNPYYVTMHDTPDRHLFIRDKRTLSSGCIRVEDPLRLAEWLLEHDKEWTMERLEEEIEEGENLIIDISRTVPAEIVYITARAADGHVYWYDDVYSFDGAVSRALKSEPPRSDSK
ncbi:MAG: hypothetical protein EA408_09675 [Marinilabiliales bacterium]|nr:MAG: hypothetical protein EA408_09675 [Marinilabiliales bacterium]